MPGKVFLSAQGLKALPCQHFPATDGGLEDWRIWEVPLKDSFTGWVHVLQSQQAQFGFIHHHHRHVFCARHHGRHWAKQEALGQAR